MKLEAGMYARTKRGKIFKVNDTNVVGKYYHLDIRKEREILKASFNIIDLIEEGDYVNGVEVITIYEEGNGYVGNRDYIFKEKIIEVANDNYETIPFEALFTNRQIENVVTKEQFESMSYKVGE